MSPFFLATVLDFLAIAAPPALEPTVEAEEDVYTYSSSDNGSGPLWCHGSTCLVRIGDDVFASGVETLEERKPLNNVRWTLHRRGPAGWELCQKDEVDRTREPCPLVGFSDGRLFLSVNPTLTPLDAYGGPAEPRILELSAREPRAPFKTILPAWEGKPEFTEHSYRSFAADGARKEMILLQNIGYTHAEWAFRDREGRWAAAGKLRWPWGADYPKPEPIRVCYPTVALRDRAVHFAGVSDILEPYPQWRAYKKEVTGRDWDYDFRRLFYAWTPDIASRPFSEWVEVSSRDKTCGWIFPCDLWIAPDGAVHLLWSERAIDERLRDKFFPTEKQRISLEHAVLRDGKVVSRKAIAEAREGVPGETPGNGRFHVTEDDRLFVFYYTSGTRADGTSVSENRIVELFRDGSVGPAVSVPLKLPFNSLFNATPRAGSPPSARLEILGEGGKASTMRYARIRLSSSTAAESCEGKFFRGEGDVSYLRLLDIARRMLAPDPELQNLSMLYMPDWNGFVEGPTWGMWWIQNSYGPSYCVLPFLEEPLSTFLENSQDLWFRRMGDGKKTWVWHGDHGVVPDGQLCDAASASEIIHKQGDGRVEIHDWGLEFTAAGVLLEAELLLIGRDAEMIAHYVPLLERSADFLDTRRDPKTNLFLAGPAANLLAPSYAGWKRPDGTYGMAYLAGLSITYIAALDRLIEVERLAGRGAKAELYARRRDLAREGLPRLQTEEGYFVKSIDPDGTRHGVLGAKAHGYFEASPNHDAVCFRVVDEAASGRILEKMLSIKGLRPHDLIIANCPSLDDMYTAPEGLWGFGTWVNGGHWSTCEARMMMAYYRFGKHDDALRSMERILGFARQFRMDNPLVAFGSAVYQPHEPINLCYDSFGPPAAFIRGLFEYLYTADGLRLVPHIPRGVTRLEQLFPVRLGTKRIYLATAGSGPVTGAALNGKPWSRFDAESVVLPFGEVPQEAAVEILLGGAAARGLSGPRKERELPPQPSAEDAAAARRLIPIITVNDLPLRFGADSNGGSRFVGDMDRASVWGRALGDGEVAELHRLGPGAALKDAALVADYDFESRDGGAFPNRAGDGLAAKVVGDVETADAPGALQFTGAGYLEVPDDPRLDLSREVTLAAWIRPGKLPESGGRIIDKTGVGTSNGYLLDTHPGSSLRVIVEAGSLGHDARLEAGKWSHVAATVTAGGKVTLYIGGAPVASREFGAGSLWDSVVAKAAKVRGFHERLVQAGLGETYEAAHARLALECFAVIPERLRLESGGKIPPLPPQSQIAADRSYLTTVERLCDGLERAISGYKDSPDAGKRRILELWGR